MSSRRRRKMTEIVMMSEPTIQSSVYIRICHTIPNELSDPSAT